MKITSKIKELEKRIAIEIGPRGGRIIGKTSTGKPVYDDKNHPSHSDFNHVEKSEATEHLSNHSLPKVYDFSDRKDEENKTVYKHKNGSEAHLHHNGSWEVKGPGNYHIKGNLHDGDRLEKALNVARD